MTILLTGLPGAGKSTLARALKDALVPLGHHVEVLDGDEFRQAVSPELGFSKADRDRNVMRLGLVARLLSRNGVIAIVAAIAPYRATRQRLREQQETPFVEIYVSCPLEVLIQRDPKGLYARALNGQLDHFTGINDPYEPPPNPEVVLDTSRQTVPESVAIVLEEFKRRDLPPRRCC